jgi:hypothetical protein
MKASPTTLCRRDRGAVIPLVALALPVLMIMTAFAVDLGRQRDSRRTMQARADVIALDMIREAQGRTSFDVWDDPETDLALAASAERNEVTLDGTPVNGYATGPGSLVLEVIWGQWEQGTGFVPHHQSPQIPPSNDLATAVEVTITEVTDYLFQPGSGSATRRAVATQDTKAGAKIGSFAAVVDPNLGPLDDANRLVNSTIHDIIGPTTSSGGPLPGDPDWDATVLGYHGLAVLNVTWEDVAAELGFVTPEEVFTGDVTAGEVLRAALVIAQRDNPDLVAGIVGFEDVQQPINVEGSILDDVYVEDVLTVEPGSERAALSATLNVLDLLATSAFVANGDSGVSVPAIDLGPPDMQIASGSLHLIQVPQEWYGGIGEGADTSQLALDLASGTGTTDAMDMTRSQLESLFPGIGDLVCDLLLLGPLLCGDPTVSVSLEYTLTLSLDIAQATGTTEHIGCGDPLQLDIGVLNRGIDLLATLQTTIVVNGEHLWDLSVPIPPTSSGETASTVYFDIPPDDFDQYKPADGLEHRIVLDDPNLAVLGDLADLLETDMADIVETLNEDVLVPLQHAVGPRLFSSDVAAKAIECRAVMLVG